MRPVQPLNRVVGDTGSGDDDAGKIRREHDCLGASGGARLELGPVRVGAGCVSRQRGGHESRANEIVSHAQYATSELRAFTGCTASSVLVLGKLQLAAGGGVAAADQIDAERSTPRRA